MLSDEVETVIRQLIDSYYMRKERPRVIDLHRQIALACRSGGLPTPSYKAVWRPSSRVRSRKLPFGPPCDSFITQRIERPS